MVELTDAMVAVIALTAGVALLAVGLAAWAVAGQRRVRRACRVVAEDREEDVLALLQRHLVEIDALRGEVAALAQGNARMREMLAGSVSNVATIRYDAFDNVGGHLSYSTALLDERGRGVVLTSINGRVESHAYAKPVEQWRGAELLSEEEEAVIRRALEAASGGHDRVAAGAPTSM